MSCGISDKISEEEVVEQIKDKDDNVAVDDSIDASFEKELIEMEREVLLSKLRPSVEMVDEYRRIIQWISKYIDSQMIESSKAAAAMTMASKSQSKEAKAASAVSAIDQYFNVSIPCRCSVKCHM